jgi:heme o synthase
LFAPRTLLIVSGFLGIVILVVLTNLTAAILAAFALTYYLLVYTLWLKRRTYLATVVGAGIGVFPPIIGWFAMTNEISLVPILLGVIIAFWTIPHFWTLGIWRFKEYKSAGLNVLPGHAPVWIIIFTILTIAVSTSLIFVTSLGLIYLIAVASLGITFGLFSVSLLIKTSSNLARKTYFVSILYLLALFMVMIIDIVV